jgi:hypothetical protein
VESVFEDPEPIAMCFVRFRMQNNCNGAPAPTPEKSVTSHIILRVKMNQTHHFITGTFKEKTVFLPDEDYAKALDCLVKGIL